MLRRDLLHLLLQVRAFLQILNDLYHAGSMCKVPYACAGKQENVDFER